MAEQSGPSSEQGLPTPTAADGAALFEARETGRAELCVVDEAEIRAIGFTPQPRGEGIPEFPQAVAGFDDPVVIAAGDRLVARGLAIPESCSHWAVTASGPLLAWFSGHVRAKHRTFNAAELREPPEERSPAVQALRRRVTVVTAVTGWPMTLVERTEVPVDVGADPLPVVIEAVRPDVLVEELVAAAYESSLPPGVTLTLDLFSLTTHGPARLGVRDKGSVLLTHGHGLRHKSSRTRRCDPKVFRVYVSGMLEEFRR